MILSGQTHNVSTHKKYYSKKRKYEEGNRIDSIFQQHIANNEEPRIEETKYESLLEREFCAKNPVVLTNNPPAVVINVLDEDDFGTARDDKNLVKQRYDWIDQEMNFFENYIENIEPRMTSEEKKYRFAACLSYLKKCHPEIKKHFHPNHVANTDRLKTGFLRAAKVLEDRARNVG